ncbi:NADH-ubiquinone oxidoreductase chain 6 [Lonchura striata]|uniref:NADH-ubiquinone oxidoreductase chain 6 n=1 Tax=Lonchura striata TaxID=40157 RepID=A0A218V3I3_9PASE|nr:NADH-ubiquinone oxidoreductase chain 6 [Lonchura striata domestica]
MGNFVIFLGPCFILGELAVVSNPFYSYGVVGFVLASVAGCGWLMSLGTSFELFLVCLGRIPVGFAYSVSGSGTMWQALVRTVGVALSVLCRRC